MQGDGEVLHAIATRAANGLGWFVFRAQQWTLAVWRDEPSGRILVAPCATVGERAGEVVGAARLDEGLVGSLPIALPVDPILQRVADCLWSADPARREPPVDPRAGAGASALSDELAAALADALATPALIERFRAIGRELDGDSRPS